MSDIYIFRNTLKDLTRPKRLLMTLLLITLPSLLVLIMRAAAHKGDFKPATVYGNVASLLIFGFLLVILAVVNGTGVLSQEVEQKTITYLLTRPVPRWRILLMKFLAAFVVVTVTVWLACVLMAVSIFGVGGLSGTSLGRDLMVLPVGVLAYGALFLLLATLFNRPLMYGLLFAFGWETWVPNLPGYFGRVSLMYYLRVLAPQTKLEPDTVDLTQAASSALATPHTISTPTAWGALLGFSVFALCLALLSFSNREYVPRDDAE